MVTIVKCQCDAATCNCYGLSDGMFYQGCGWDKERAQEYADAINEFDRRGMVAAAWEGIVPDNSDDYRK